MSDIQAQAANLISDLETYTVKDGLKIEERFFYVPLDHSKPEGSTIRIFARRSVPKDKAAKPKDEEKLPYVVYLQGGPGFEVGLRGNSGFAAELYKKGYQVLWLDQRGTGLSTPLSPETLPENVKTDEEIAAYLRHFRADSIVKDCEFIRKILLGDRTESADQKWTIIGQSFGGFCSLTYLSFYPEGLKEVFLTGGLAPLGNGPDPVYEALAPRVIKRNQIYYEKYPADVKRVRFIMGHLASHTVKTPNGGHLTPRRFQQLGLEFGMQGGIDSVHQLVLRSSNDLELFKKISYKTLQSIEQAQSLDGNALYAILHEAIYCQGQASNWSALRVTQRYSQFSWEAVQSLEDTEPVYFTGEMIFPHMFDDYANLRPWKGAAEILAKDASWGPLYDLDVLAKNEVKVSAVTYFNDIYVDFNLAQDTATKVGNVEQYITNQLVHDGIRQDAVDVIKRLLSISKREID
ncbi:alpha/beta-hydrolase [Coprinopsis marcescibilis]|uniref:Alpha/beta-hydrolase n=1 Tax=Coprinopsis marcescibilis TaxID=230819 RepID=A0A5C3L0S9_COPMA|nr:alpha/beta-hydrolase [Coprinopsis marcescibilis]